MAKGLPIRIKIEDETLKCGVESQSPIWELAISTLTLIAEHTTNEGPLYDDYFLHFWSHENGQTFCADVSLYVEGLHEAIEILSDKLGTKLEFGLCGSTEWDSRIMWPPELAGHPYFRFREVLPETLKDRLKRRLFGPVHEYFLTDEVQEFLKRFDLRSTTLGSPRTDLAVVALQKEVPAFSGMPCNLHHV